jgi:hypothetical protein
MRHRFFILVITLWIITSCATEKPLLFDQAISSLQEAGYTFSTLNVPDLRCLQTASYEENKLVFMHLYCAIEDEIDMITIAFNANDSQQGLDRMLETMEHIRFPHTEGIPEFLSQNEAEISAGIQVNKIVGDWKIYASTEKSGSDQYMLVSFHSKRFLEEIEAH